MIDEAIDILVGALRRLDNKAPEEFVALANKAEDARRLALKEGDSQKLALVRDIFTRASKVPQDLPRTRSFYIEVSKRGEDGSITEYAVRPIHQPNGQPAVAGTLAEAIRVMDSCQAIRDKVYSQVPFC